MVNNHIKLDVFSEKVEKGHHETIIVLELQLSAGVNVLTPELIVQASKGKIKKTDIWGFNANIYCDERNTIIVKDFPYFTLAAYSNAEPILSHLKVYNASQFYRLNDLQVKRIDSEFANALIAGCEVEEVYVGIESWHQERLDKIDANKRIERESKTDIRGSRVGKLKTYTGQGSVNIQDSVVGELEINSSITDLHVWQGCSIQRITIGATVEKFKINDSIIEVMHGRKNSMVKEFESTNASLVKVFELYESNVLSRSSSSLEILAESYRNARNTEKQHEYSYLHQKEITNNIPRISKRVFPRLLQITCGYGYKPERGVYTLFAIWLIFAIIYSTFLLVPGFGLATNGEEISGWIGIPYSMYFSAITFTTIGYGDVVPIDWLTRFLAGLEGIFGISTMAIIIYALTKHD